MQPDIKTRWHIINLDISNPINLDNEIIAAVAIADAMSNLKETKVRPDMRYVDS